MLKAYAEMIRDLSGDNPVKRNAHLQVIIEETDRLTMLVNDILDLSKLENGSQKLELSTFDVTDWLTEICSRYKGVSEQMGYHLSFTPDENKTVTCDAGKMERVVCNLINNAINYTGDDKQVFVRQVNTENAVIIEVRDTGAGIEEDKIKKIFDKYYRSENHKREVVGTGLGLSIVKAILKLHNYGYRCPLQTWVKGLCSGFEIPVSITISSHNYHKIITFIIYTKKRSVRAVPLLTVIITFYPNVIIIPNNPYIMHKSPLHMERIFVFFHILFLF